MEGTFAPADLAELAEHAARRAGALLAAEMPKAGSPLLEQRSKSSLTDLVTSADLASEQLILGELLGARPDDGILGEEGSAWSGSSGLTWVIDPLDGTTNFVYGYGSFAVSIAATFDGETVAGVVHNPLTDETFVAARGEEATLNGQPVLVGDPPPLALALVGTGFGYQSEQRAAQSRLLPHLLPAVRDIRRSGSAALDLCFVALGRLDGFYEAGLKPWDKAAGLLIAAEAGCSWREVDGLVRSEPTLVVARQPLLDSLLELFAAI